MYFPGKLELGLIVVIILILFGPGRLPEVVKSIGKGWREFKKVSKGKKEDKPIDNKEENKDEEKS